MKRLLKTAVITLSIVAIATICFALAGCGDTPDGDNVGGGTDSEDNETYITYSLDGFNYSVSGQGDYYISLDNMSQSDHDSYDAVIAMYGRSVRISQSKVQFVDGAVLSIFGATDYTLNGNEVSIADPAIAQTFNFITLSNGVFSFGIRQQVAGITVTYSFDYYSPTASLPSFSVKFNSNGGNTVKSQSVLKGEKVIKPADPKKKDYEFAGWYSDKNCVNEWNFSSGKIYSPITLYAKWNAVISYMVEFDAQNGTCNETSRKVIYNTALGALPVPVKNGNEFGGWFTKPAGKGEEYSADTVYDLNNGITLYAKWTADVIFEYEGATSGDEIKKINFTYRGDIDVTLPNPYKTGYSFDGWFTEPDGGGTLLEYVSSIKSLSGETHFYANWIKGTDKRYFHYMFEYHSSSDYSEVIIDNFYGSSFSEVEVPAIIDSCPVTTIEWIPGSKIKKLTVPNSVTEIEDSAFGCKNLTELILPFPGNSAFKGRLSRLFSGDMPETLEKVTITGSQTLLESAFKDCSMIKEIVFVGRIHQFEENAFSGCANLQTIRFETATPYAENISENVLSGLSESLKLIVPDEYVEKYKAKFPNNNVIAKSEENA